MVEAIVAWIRGRAEHPYVRPWGLATPILVLIVCLPLLRPLLRPTEISENELGRLATIQAIVEQRTLAIDHTSFKPLREQITKSDPAGSTSVRHYSRQPPVLAALLAGPYWVLHRIGISFESNLALATYLLTFIGSTLPVAAAAGLLYRMGRLFELTRPWRMAVAMGGVFGSGLISYATVLNSHAPAAALVLACCGCLFHAGVTRTSGPRFGWLILAGVSASLAAVIDMGAMVLLVLLIAVILAMRWPVTAKVGGILCYMLGAAPVLVLHAALTIPMTGDIRPGFLHPERAVPGTLRSSAMASEADEESEGDVPTFFSTAALHFADGVLGPHGLLSHFPILLIGVAGIGVVMHRHWPVATKTLAVVSIMSAILIVGVYVSFDPDWGQPMFAVRWFIVFLPLLVFWSGAWLRKPHHPAMWAGVTVLLAFSVVTSLIGATAPFTTSRPGEYTLYAAARQLFRPPAQTIHLVAER